VIGRARANLSILAAMARKSTKQKFTAAMLRAGAAAIEGMNALSPIEMARAVLHAALTPQNKKPARKSPAKKKAATKKKAAKSVARRKAVKKKAVRAIRKKAAKRKAARRR
jgi:hypothetical protein